MPESDTLNSFSSDWHFQAWSSYSGVEPWRENCSLFPDHFIAIEYLAGQMNKVYISPPILQLPMGVELSWDSCKELSLKDSWHVSSPSVPFAFILMCRTWKWQNSILDHEDEGSPHRRSKKQEGAWEPKDFVDESQQPWVAYIWTLTWKINFFPI